MNILFKLLKESKISIDEKELEFQLLSHPSYPSLHSITGVLNHFGISNVALEVSKTIETLNQLPEFFLAYIKDLKNDDIVLVSKKDSKIRLIYNEKKTENFSTDKFLDIWTGVIVGVEKDNEDIPINKKTDLTLNGSILSMLFVIILFFYFNPNLFQSIHFLLSFFGLAISIIIVKHELGYQSRIAEKFCPGNVDKINCDDVLKSKAANFFGVFKMSDIGIVYFLALIVSWLLLTINEANYDLLILITILVVPFTFYSILYQYFVVKKWCLLCLSVVLVLWLQATSLYFTDININSSFSINSLTLISFSYFFVIVFWQFVLPKMKKEIELGKFKIEHFKFKRNYSIFKVLLSRSIPINPPIDNVHEIVFGNKESKFLKVVVITNPLCGFCKDVHKLVENLLGRKNIEFQILICFNVSLNSEAIDTKIAIRLLELYDTKGEQNCLKAMHDIYTNLSPTKWFDKWGKAGNLKYIEILKAEKDWCQHNKINFTPEILINGMSFPNEYERSDLLYFIEDIIEDEELKIESSISELEYIS